MAILLRYLEANGLATLIASGGDRDSMRPFAGSLYGIPPERVIGSSNALQYDADRLQWADDAGWTVVSLEDDWNTVDRDAGS